MVFYEIELKDTPRISVACSVEYDGYKNRFRHPTNFLEIALCEQGRIVHEYANGEKELLGPGMLIPAFSDAEYVSYAYKGERQRHTTVIVNAEYSFRRYSCAAECNIEELRERMKNNCTITILIPYHYHVGSAYEELLYSLKKICVRTNSDTPSGRALALSEWYRLAGMLSDTVFAELIEAQTDVVPSEFVYADKAAEFIVDNYMKKLTVPDVAKHLGISEGYLHRVFRNVKGMGVTEYLNRHRVSVAIELMEKKGLSLREAAQNTGIEDPAYMSRLFKKVTGLSCREYFGNKRMYRDVD